MFATNRIRIITSDQTSTFGSYKVDKKSPTPYSDATKVKNIFYIFDTYTVFGRRNLETLITHQKHFYEKGFNGIKY